MDIRKFKKIDEVYNYWQELIKVMPEDYELAYKIAGISGNDNFDDWTNSSQKFDKVIELALYLERNPDSKESWLEIKELIHR